MLIIVWFRLSYQVYFRLQDVAFHLFCTTQHLAMIMFWFLNVTQWNPQQESSWTDSDRVLCFTMWVLGGNKLQVVTSPSDGKVEGKSGQYFACFALVGWSWSRAQLDVVTCPSCFRTQSTHLNNPWIGIKSVVTPQRDSLTSIHCQPQPREGRASDICKNPRLWPGSRDPEDPLPHHPKCRL